jgi:3-methyladenine DNA glycosylase AlkC
MSEKFSLKDELFNPHKVEYLAGLIKKAYPAFEDDNFIKNIVKKLPKLELKQRIFWITDNITLYLPDDFTRAIDIILQSLPPELDATKTDDDFGDFIFAPFGYFVVNNGCNDAHLELSLYALSEITKRFTVEDAIRYVINAYPQQSFAFMQKMAISTHYHQRRLASEGLRPKLPWCIGLDFEYQRAIQILDMLYYDKTRFVVRSVANHLNDIAKIDANLVVQTLTKWQQQDKQQDSKQWQFLVKHSLRTLVKKGDTNALQFLGFNPHPRVHITHFCIKNNTINLGDYLEFSFTITGCEKLIIDYQIHYPNNTKKVFKIKQLHLKNTQHITKKHLFKAMTTKKLYSGLHTIQLQINGKLMDTQEFFLQC